MNLFQQLAAAALLVALTLCLQCAGVAVTVEWLKTVAIRGVRKLPIAHSAVLVMQTTLAIILLQGAIILLWADGYRRLCLWSWQSAFYFSAASYSTVGYGDVVLPSRWRLLGPSGEHDGRADVRDLGKPAVCAHQSAARRQDTGSASESIMNMPRSSWSRLPSGALPVDEARHA